MKKYVKLNVNADHWKYDMDPGIVLIHDTGALAVVTKNGDWFVVDDAGAPFVMSHKKFVKDLSGWYLAAAE